MKKKLGLALTIIISLVMVANNAVAFTTNEITRMGPGDRIHGMDISYWQHPNGKLINFKTMYNAGIRFVLIKGGDSQTKADAQALKYLKIDRPAAQAAGIYTGFYFYSYMPDSTDKAFIVRDAQAQAQKAIWRLASIGGYTENDIPMALDLEDNCVRKANGVCTKFMNRIYVTLWAKTWLATVAEKTGKKPFIYSYPLFLERNLVRDSELRSYPLWLARYTKDPFTSSPNSKTVGCYAHSWTNANCSAQWQLWQYTSCGIAKKYGVPGTRVDLNVFGGSSAQFNNLTSGTWIPESGDLLPEDEATTMALISQSSTDTNGTSKFTVDVTRPDGTPVVTGEVKWVNADSTIGNGTQSLARAATGRWVLSITKLPAGTHIGALRFIDITGTHADNEIPVSFDVAQGPTPSPTPKPSVKPSPKPAGDGCAAQIRI